MSKARTPEQARQFLLANHKVVDCGYKTPCWVWLGALNKGYGEISVMGKRRYAHQASHELFVGPLTVGLHFDHLCRNRACINPDHLEQVTIRVNILRGEGLAAKNAAKTHCPQGHPYDLLNTYIYPKNNGRHCRACKLIKWHQRKSNHADSKSR
jgi:hypothetical protein